MGFPDRIERTVEIAHPPAKVWAALTTAEGLGAWFGNEATIDLRPGGSASMRWDHGHTADMRIVLGQPVDVPGVAEYRRLLDSFHPHVGGVTVVPPH